MSSDLTKNLNGSLEDKIDRLITIVESMDSRLESMDLRLKNVETRVGSLETLLINVDARLGRLETRVENIEDRLGSLETKVENIEDRLRSLETLLVNVDARLGSLETKVDERLKETRPMWEAVQAQMIELKESQEKLRGEMEKGFRLIDRRLELHSIEMQRLHGYQRDLEERVDKLEKLQS